MKAQSLGLATLLSGMLTAQSPFVAAESFHGAGMTYDEARDRLVLAPPTSWLWEWNGSAWRRTLATAPLGRVVYDPARERVFLVGVRTYEYDGFGVVDRGPAPNPQRVAADPARGRLVGLRTNGLTGIAIHEYDGNGWSIATTIAGLHTPYSVAFDRVRGVTVLSAITSVGPVVQYQIWEWNGTTLTGPISQPGPPDAFAWDPVGNRLLAISATSTRVWNGTAMTTLVTSRQPPSITDTATDARNGGVWAFGNAVTTSGEVWWWDGNDWSAIATALPPLVGVKVTYDAGRGRVVQLGESTSAVTQPPTGIPRTVEWDRQRWLDRAPATSPARLFEHAQAYDAARAMTLVFGGSDLVGTPTGETWGWDGTSWHQLATGGPPARRTGAMAFDSMRNVVALVGGADVQGLALADHWEWDGLTWTQVATATAIGPDVGSLGFDPTRDRLVFVGQHSDTFEYDGAAWSHVASGSARGSGLPLVWNPGRQRLHGSLYTGITSGGRFEWDGASWLPVAGEFGAIAFDAGAGYMVDVTPGRTLLEIATPATAEAFGAGCGAGTTPTSLTPFGRPRIGSTDFGLDVRAAATMQPAIVALGLSAVALPLPNGCTLQAGGDLGTYLSSTDSFGVLQHTLPLPAAPALVGVMFHAQAGVLDAASPGGFALTQGLRLAIGS